MNDFLDESARKKKPLSFPAARLGQIGADERVIGYSVVSVDPVPAFASVARRNSAQLEMLTNTNGG